MCVSFLELGRGKAPDGTCVPGGRSVELVKTARPAEARRAAGVARGSGRGLSGDHPRRSRWRVPLPTPVTRMRDPSFRRGTRHPGSPPWPACTPADWRVWLPVSRQSLVPAGRSACRGYTCRPPGWATRQTQGSPLPRVPDMHSARAGPKPLAVGGGQVYLEDESSSWVGLVGGGGADWTSDRRLLVGGWPGRFDLASQERRGAGPGFPRAGHAALAGGPGGPKTSSHDRRGYPRMVWRMNRDRATFDAHLRWFPSRGNVPRTSVQPVRCVSVPPGLVGGKGRGARPCSRPRIVPPQPWVHMLGRRALGALGHAPPCRA